VSGDRLALTLGVLAFAAAVWALMLRGWRGRQRRQADLPAPPAPPATRGQVVVGAVPGLVVGTVLRSGTGRDWLDRVAVHRLSDRATADLVVTADGVHLERDGLPELFVPHAAVVEAAPGEALAGRVVGREGMLLLTWRLGERLVTTGFRATDHSQHRRLADAITALAPLDPQKEAAP
jgi:hypothetical protein